MIGRDSFILPEVEEFNILSRKLSIYQDIYDYEAYEFRNCIAYECAVRNDEVKIEISNYHKILHENIYSDYNFDKLNTFGINEEVAKHIILGRESSQDDKYNRTNSLLSNQYNYPSIPKELTSNLSCKYIRQRDGKIVQIAQGDDSLYQVTHGKLIILDEEYIANVPLLTLSLSMHRPKMMNPNNHKYFLVEMNFNAEVHEMIEQINVMKEVYENDIKENVMYRQQLEEETNTIIRGLCGYLDKKKVAFASLLNYTQFHENKKENLSSSELFSQNKYSEVPPKDILKLKHDTYIDILWIYDVMTSFKEYTKKCKIEKEESIKSLTNKENMLRLDKDDRESLRNDIVKLYEDNQTTEKEIYKILFKGIKSIRKTTSTTVIKNRYQLGRNLIEKKKYLYLI